MEVCFFLNFNHATPYILAMNNLENSLTMLHFFFFFFHMLGCMRTCNQISWEGVTIFNTSSLLSFHSFHHHHPFVISFTIHQHFFFDKSFVALCFIHIDIGMIHKDKEKASLCTMTLYILINILSFSVRVWQLENK